MVPLHLVETWALADPALEVPVERVVLAEGQAVLEAVAAGLVATRNPVAP